MNISNEDMAFGKIIEINTLIGSICESLNVEAYLVGGFTRDCIIGSNINDIDIVNVVNIILDGSADEEDILDAAVNEDGDINILDIVILVGIILQN